MKSQLREVMSLIQHGPEDANNCVVYYYDRISDQVFSISFNEFIKMRKEFGIPDHRIRAIISTKNGLKRILFKKSNYSLPELIQ